MTPRGRRLVIAHGQGVGAGCNGPGNRPEMAPLGTGEGATIPPAAAIANAIFDAVAVRLREGPFTPRRVLAAMQKKA